MLVTRYPLSILVGGPTKARRRVRPALAVALAWVAMTALLPLTMQQSPAEPERTAIAATAELPIIQASSAPTSTRLAALSKALLWPFGLTPAKAMTVDADAIVPAEWRSRSQRHPDTRVCQRSQQTRLQSESQPEAA